MSVSLRLVRLHARSTLQIYSTSSLSCRRAFSIATRISQIPGQNSSVWPLAINTRTFLSPNFPFTVPQKLSPTRFTQFSIRRFTQNTVWNATHHDRWIPAGGQRPPSDKYKTSWIDTLPPPVIFWSIFAINVGVYLAWSYAEGAARTLNDIRPKVWMYDNFTSSLHNIKSGRIWTILTACFSQMDTTHLLFNGFTYFFMAQPVLAMLGNRQFLIIYLGGGIMSSLTSIVWNNFVKDTPVASLGASGAIYAILSYFACRLPHTKLMIFGILPVPAWVFVPGVLLYDSYEMMAKHKSSDADAAGHVGGILAGAFYYLSRVAGIRL